MRSQTYSQTQATEWQTPVISGRRLRSYVELMRPANLLTAAADIVAGSTIVGAVRLEVTLLAVASMSLYAGGVVLNDVFDRTIDSAERPERPIPSGRVSAKNAAILGSSLLLLGVLLCLFVSRPSGSVAAAIVAAVLLYDSFAKHHRLLGPVNMGLCRALNLALGMTAASSVAFPGERWMLALLPLVYIAAVTAMSSGEVRGGTSARILLPLILICAVLLALPFMAWLGSAPHTLSMLPFAALLAWRVVPPAWRAYRSPQHERVRAAVKAGVLSLVIFDSAIVAAYQGPIVGLVVLLLLPAAALLARMFAVT